MNIPRLCLPLLLSLSGAAAADGSVGISAPQDGAVLNGKSPVKVIYAVTGSVAADHVHLTVDGGKPALLPLEGSHTVKTLAPGKHTICVTATDVGHTPIGLERCIKVTAQ